MSKFSKRLSSLGLFGAGITLFTTIALANGSIGPLQPWDVESYAGMNRCGVGNPAGGSLGTGTYGTSNRTLWTNLFCTDPNNVYDYSRGFGYKVDGSQIPACQVDDEVANETSVPTSANACKWGNGHRAVFYWLPE